MDVRSASLGLYLFINLGEISLVTEFISHRSQFEVYFFKLGLNFNLSRSSLYAIQSIAVNLNLLVSSFSQNESLECGKFD